MYHILYKTTNNINGRYYIGIHSTTNIDDGYVGSGSAFKKALKKHGKENFTREIILFALNRESLSYFETIFVTENVCNDPQSYNIRTGGDECYAQNYETRMKMSQKQRGIKRTPERIKQMSEFMIKNNPMQSDVSRNKVRESKLGIKRSNDLKKKVSETLTGKYPAWLNPRVQANPELTKRWLLLDKIYDLKERNVPNSDIAKSLKVFPHTTSMRSMLDYIVNNGDPRKNPQWVQFKKHHSGE